MNIKLVIFFFMCFETANFQKSQLFRILQSKTNFYHKIHYNIDSIMNKLFTPLKINTNLSKSTNFQMLRTLYLYFNKMAKKYYRVNEQLRYVSDVNFNKSDKHYLEEIIQKFVQEEIDELKNDAANITRASRYYNQTEYIGNAFNGYILNRTSTPGPDYNKDEYAENAFENYTTNITLGLRSGYNNTKYTENAFENFTTNSKLAAEPDYSKTEFTENASENYNELLSNIGDKTIENLINPILNETMVSNKFSFYTGNIIGELKAWGISSEESEPHDNNTRRIYKGKKTKIKNYPFIVSIHMMDEFLCGGSIISKDMVISAASCLQTAYNNGLQGDRARSIFIRVGSGYVKHSGNLIPVGQLFFHPNYNSVNLRHNLVIIKTVEKLKLSTKRMIKRIKIDRTANALSSDIEEVTILGWGYKDAKHKPSNQKLALARLDIYDTKDCEEVYSKFYVTEKNFCAGFTSKGSGACMGDVGGPAVVSKELVGVISFGPAVCGMADAPTVLTKVGYYAEWIDSIINQKPETRNEKLQYSTFHMTTTHSTVNSPQLELMVIPLYTTETSLTTESAPAERSKIKEYSEEIHALKEIIQEFILTNRTVIDYLVNGQFLDDEELIVDPSISYENEKLFLDLENYKSDTMKTKLLRQSQNVTKAVPRHRLNKATDTIIKPKTKQPLKIQIRTTRPSTDYDDTEGLIKKTTIVKFFESSEFPNEDFSNYDKDIPHLSDDMSSYYEIEIPIEVTDSISRAQNITVMSFFPQNKTATTKTYHYSDGIIYMSDELNVNKPSATEQSDEMTDERSNSVKNKKTERPSSVGIIYNIVLNRTKFATNHEVNTTYAEPKNNYQLPLPAGIGIPISDDDINYTFNDKTHMKQNSRDHKKQPDQQQHLTGPTNNNRGVWWNGGGRSIRNKDKKDE